MRKEHSCKTPSTTWHLNRKWTTPEARQLPGNIYSPKDEYGMRWGDVYHNPKTGKATAYFIGIHVTTTSRKLPDTQSKKELLQNYAQAIDKFHQEEDKPSTKQEPGFVENWNEDDIYEYARDLETQTKRKFPSSATAHQTTRLDTPIAGGRANDNPLTGKRRMWNPFARRKRR